jgi:hypothetical protein
MTQSLSAQFQTPSDEATRHQRLMEWVAAEDAANGEVGCGQVGNSSSSDFGNHVVLDDEKLRQVLRLHLGHILREPDFDSITTQIQGQIESCTALSIDTAIVPEHIPTGGLTDIFQPHIAELGSELSLESLLQFCHHVIHRAVLQPRHTWALPIWVLRGGTHLYIAQAANIEAAIAQAKTQHPKETETLEVVTVGGILAPNQVIAIQINENV